VAFYVSQAKYVVGQIVRFMNGLPKADFDGAAPLFYRHPDINYNAFVRYNGDRAGENMLHVRAPATNVPTPLIKLRAHPPAPQPPKPLQPPSPSPDSDDDETHDPNDTEAANSDDSDEVVGSSAPLGPSATHAAPSSVGRRKRTPWSSSEEAALREGVSECGTGSWASILSRFADKFHPVRTSVDLRDKWRNLTR